LFPATRLGAHSRRIATPDQLATLRRLDRPVELFNWDRFLNILHLDDQYAVKDVANAVHIAGFDRTRDAFLQSLEAT
jgi:hypothetical protein